ncbi:MAG: type II toxin-antitoxin system RelE/ParE family toxin [Candidatus Krumholzibacteriia bacterium]
MLFEVGEAIRGLEDGAFSNLARAIDSLAFAPRREDAEELPEGFWLLRSGDFAIVYVIDDDRSIVRVVHLGIHAG